MVAQYDNASERGLVNARLRWTRRPGPDHYLVNNSTWPTGLDEGMPSSRPLGGGFVMKYVHFLRR